MLGPLRRRVGEVRFLTRVLSITRISCRAFRRHVQSGDGSRNKYGAVLRCTVSRDSHSVARWRENVQSPPCVNAECAWVEAREAPEIAGWSARASVN